MTPAKLDAAVVTDRIQWVDRMIAGIRNLPLDNFDASTAELYDICTGQLQDIETIRDAIRDWIRAHPESIDGSI